MVNILDAYIRKFENEKDPEMRAFYRLKTIEYVEFLLDHAEREFPLETSVPTSESET